MTGRLCNNRVSEASVEFEWVTPSLLKECVASFRLRVKTGSSALEECFAFFYDLLSVGPQSGRQRRGFASSRLRSLMTAQSVHEASPLDPQFLCTTMFHGARVDETPSARGSLAISAEMVKVSSQNRMAMIFRSFPNLGDGKREFGRRNRICRTQEIYL